MTNDPVGNLKTFLEARGYLVGGDLTREGRAWLREQGAVIADDKSLLQLGLETLCDEVAVEEMEKRSGRRMSEKQ